MTRRLNAQLWAVSISLALAGCACSEKTAPKDPSRPGERTLDPVPEPPAFKADQLPGAGSALEVVAARPVGDPADARLASAC